MRLYCLHGFLGSPRDWDGFGAEIGKSLPHLAAPGAVVKVDLFGQDAFPEAASIPAWAETYCRREMNACRLGPQQKGNFLLGYSLGGRLALHMAVQFPEVWDGVVIVGANPGLDSEEARDQRRRHDETWARRFESEPWETVLAAWDAQPVFAGRHVASERRRVGDLSRARQADALRRWSLGMQPPLWPALRTLPMPVLWVAGVEDAGQVSITHRVRESVPHVETWIAPEAGHRVPWEQPQAFTARVVAFLKTTHQNGGENE